MPLDSHSDFILCCRIHPITSLMWPKTLSIKEVFFLLLLKYVLCLYLFYTYCTFLKYFIHFRFDCSCILCTESYFPLIFCFICLSHAISLTIYLFLVPLACHILECCDGLAQNVIGTIGQAFELQFRQYLHSPPKAIPTTDRCDSHNLA